jgi:hypothetical protein
VQDVIDFDRDFQRIGDVMPDDFEAGMTEKMGDILRCAGEEIIHGDDLVTHL